jgi:hypothetical protein
MRTTSYVHMFVSIWFLHVYFKRAREKLQCSIKHKFKKEEISSATFHATPPIAVMIIFTCKMMGNI